MTVTAVLVGMLAGVVLAWLLLRRRVEVWTAAAVDRWRLAEAEAMRQDSVLRSRTVLRGRASEQLAPLTTAFPFDPGDARFIGSPIDFVVFDGYREVRAGTRAALRRIVLVDVKTGSSSLTTIQRRVRDCLADGRYSWHQVRDHGRARLG